MVYYARRYRRKGVRRNRTLSTRRIFNNKGAKAQASQIYALRKSIRRVQRQCRPEVKTVKTSTENRGLALSDVATPGSTNYSMFSMALPGAGVGDNQRVGDKITILNPRIFCALQYLEQKNSSMSYYDSTLNNHGIQVRLIAVQSKVSLQTAPQLTDILQNVNYNSQIDSMMMMRQPFRTGVTSSYSILLDKRMTVSSDSPTKSYRINVRPKSRSVVYEQGFSLPKGTIFCFVLQGGASFHRFEQAEDYVYDWNKVDFTFQTEVPFTDA